MPDDLKKNLLIAFRLYQDKGYESKKTPIDGLPKDYPAYTLILDGEVGVFFASESEINIDEEFQGCRVHNSHLEGVGNSLILSTDSQDDRILDIFAGLCSTFVETDDRGIKRSEIASDPFAWFHNVEKSIGNAILMNPPYSILAELYSLHVAAQNCEQPKWEGPDGALVDIRGKSIDIEVKSSIRQSVAQITISRELQLKKAENDLHLYYVCLQKTDAGISINDIVDKLVQEDGMNREEIELKLEKKGFRKGKSSRMERYLITKMWDFIVDEDFPKIVPESFKDGKMPEFITGITYTIDVSGLDYKNLL